MRIENNYQQQTFSRAYLDMQSLNRYGYGKKLIIEALKEMETPLRKYLKNVVNTKDFEKDMGDCFISFNRQRHFGEGANLFDMIRIRFPKRDKIYNITEDTSFHAGFRDYDLQNGAEELAEYIKGEEIVKDLKKHIAKYRN